MEPTGLTVCAEECEASASFGEAITAESMRSYASENCCDDGVCVEVVRSDFDVDNCYIPMPLKPLI